MGMESIYRLSVMVNMIDRMTGPSVAVTKAVNGAAGQVQNYNKQIAQMTTEGAAMIGVGTQIANAAAAPVKATFETQDALAELSSLGIEDLGRLEQAATDFSKTWAGTTKPQFLTAAYDIKSGIASLSDDGVANMTRIAGVTAKATKATIDEMTNLFATGYGIYKDYYGAMSDEAFGEMFSAGIAKSVQQFKTTGTGMAQAISALGGSATAANVPMEEQLSILGMLQATMSGSEAGTKYTAFLQSAGKAGQELGLKFTDTNGQLKSMPEILGAIKGKFGETMTAADKLELQKAFGTVEAVKLIDLLYGKTDDLQGNILTLYDTMGQGMSITEEMANKINAPPGQSWELFVQKVRAGLESIGSAMLPTFMQLQAGADKLIDKFVSFAEQNPQLLSTIMYTVLAFGGLIAAIGSGKFVLGNILMLISTGKGIVLGAASLWGKLTDGITYARLSMMYAGDFCKKLGMEMYVMASYVKRSAFAFLTWAKQGIMSAAAALPGLIASVWSFTAALLANPITWVVVGIIALIAAIILLWKNWDSVTAFISNVWNSMCSGVMAGIDWIKSGIDNIVAWFQEKLDAFKALGGGIVGNIVDGIMSVGMMPFNAVKGIFDKVRSLLPFSDAKEGPLSDLTLSGQRVFTTFNDGMMQTADLPAQTVEGAFAKADDAAALEPGTDTAGGKGKTTIIQKVVLYVKPEDIKDLQKLKQLLEQMDDINNSYADPIPEV